MISRVILIKDNVILLIIQTAKLHGDCSKSDGLLFLIRATLLSPDWLLSKYYLYANENLKSRCTCDTESDVSLWRQPWPNMLGLFGHSVIGWCWTMLDEVWIRSNIQSNIVQHFLCSQVGSVRLANPAQHCWAHARAEARLVLPKHHGYTMFTVPWIHGIVGWCWTMLARLARALAIA